jgi:hypothetical protein
MNEMDPQTVEAFVKEVVRIERRFSSEQKNQRSNRLSELKDFVERFAAERLGDEDSETPT